MTSMARRVAGGPPCRRRCRCPTRRSPSRRRARGPLGPGVRGEVQVGLGTAEERVPDGAADEVEPVPGRREQVGELRATGGTVTSSTDRILLGAYAIAKRWTLRQTRQASLGAVCGRCGAGATRRRRLLVTIGTCPPPAVARAVAAEAARRPPPTATHGRRDVGRWADRRPDESGAAAVIGRLDRRGRLLWSLPKGHIEEGETAEQAAVREVEEETGIIGASSRRSAPSTSGSSPRTAASTRRCTTSCCAPPAASCPTRTSRSPKSPGCRSRSSRPGWPTPMNGG